MNLRMAMQKYASGGSVKPEKPKQASGGMATYDYNAPQNGDRVKIPGVAGDPKDGKVIVFWDHPNKRVVVSDEGYWNPDSAVGDELKKAVDWAHAQGYQAGVVTTPYASDRFGDDVRTAGGFTRMRPPASDQQLKDYVDAADFVVADPYILDQATSTPEMQENFANFTKNVGDYANAKGKDTWLVLQGFNTPNVDPNVTQAYNDRLASENAGRYNNLSFYTPEKFENGETPVNLQQTFNTATQAAQPFKMAEKIGVDLPTDWSNRGATSKIDWLNQHNVDPNALGQAGVAQSDIDWMTQHGYAGNPDVAPKVVEKPFNPAFYNDMRDMPTYDPTSIYGGPGSLGNDSPMGSYTRAPTGYDDLTAKAVASPYANNGPIQKSSSDSVIYGGLGSLGNDSPMGPYTPVNKPPRPQDYAGPWDDTTSQPLQPQTSYTQDANGATTQIGYDGQPLSSYSPEQMAVHNAITGTAPAAPAAPDYSGAYAALGGADVVNGLRDQFSQMGLDENTIGSIFSKYYGQG
jgi:hypothetical protein